MADLLLIIFSFFTSEELFSLNGLFYQVKPWHVLAMYSIVTLTIPWYLGYIFARNKPYYSKIFMKITLWLFIVMVLMILVNLMRLVFQLDAIEEQFKNDINGFMAAFALFLLIIGPMMCISGAVTGQEELEEIINPGKKKTFEKNNVMTVFIILIISIAVMLYIFGVFPKDYGILAVFCGFFGGPLVAIVTYGLFLGLIKLLNNIGIYPYLKMIAQNSFPFFIIAVLVFWSGMAIYFMQRDFGNGYGQLSMGGMLFSVFVSGLIPFRILMMFNAPLRVTNIVIGILSLAYFLFQMMNMIR